MNKKFVKISEYERSEQSSEGYRAKMSRYAGIQLLFQVEPAYAGKQGTPRANIYVFSEDFTRSRQLKTVVFWR